MNRRNTLPDWQRFATYFLVLLSAAFYLLYFVHLRADFPNFSPWNDWAKSTDEGWYASGAVHQKVLGNWYSPGAFNPAVPMPVWSVLAALWFRVAGFGIVQLRVLALLVFGASMAMLWALVRRHASVLMATLAVALILLNPFSYGFQRLAILEPVLVFWMLLCWILARRAALSAWPLYSVVLGMSMTALLLTKSTGLVLLPSVAAYFILCGQQEGSARSLLFRRGVIATAVMAISFGAYQLAMYSYRQDSRLLFSVNHGRVHLSIVPRYFMLTLRDGGWIHPVLFPLACLSLLGAAIWLRTLWKSPLFTAAALAAAGYLMFILYHGNLQPRYYLVVAPSISIVLVLTLQLLMDRGPQQSNYRWSTVCFAGIMLTTIVTMTARTLRYITHPQYTFLSATNSIRGVIDSTPSSNRFIVSDLGDEISLFTGLPSICESYAVFPPADLDKMHHPGWFIYLIGTNKTTPMRQYLFTHHSVVEVARYDIFDDPAHHILVLYKVGSQN